MKCLIIKNSFRYKGLGVFSDRDYKKGEVVNTYDISISIRKNEYDSLPKTEKWKYYYDSKNMAAYKLDEITVRINHSCGPNVASDKNGSDLAIRNIAKNEEITAWYMNYDPAGTVCLCGSSHCLGRVSLQ